MTGSRAPRSTITSKPLTTLAMFAPIALSAAIALGGCGKPGDSLDISEHQGKLCPPGGCEPEDPPPTGTIDPPPRNLRFDGSSEYGAAIRFDCAPKIAATARNRSEIEVRLTDQSQNEGDFRVWRRKLGDVDWTLISQSKRYDGTGRLLKGHRGTGETIKVIDTGRAANTTYECRASADHAWGESPRVTTRETTLPYPPAAPSAPTIGDTTTNSISIAWDGQ